MNEEEIIEELRNSYELHQCEWAKRFLDTIEAELEKKDKQINSKNGTINALHNALKERTEERDRKDDIITKQNKMINLIYDFLYKFSCKFSGSFMKALSEDGFDISK